MGVFDDDDNIWTRERLLSQKLDPELIREAVEKIRPILVGLGPTIQGGVLADVQAIWLASHPPVARADALEVLLDTVRRLVPENERAIFGSRAHPNADAGPDQTNWDAIIKTVK